MHVTFEPQGEYRIAPEAGQRARRTPTDDPSRESIGEGPVASPVQSVAEEGFEIAVESLQELVDLDDVVDRDRLA
jgi:hypothetical protein